ncbi:MAG: MGH1-like glycoside hydrolase domain-containing protein [Acidimicrobiales bacterium]
MSPFDLKLKCREVLRAAWQEEAGFCVPNQTVYPHQWLWDSCFHSVTWAAFGDERGVEELRSALANQASSGFVPHMNYWLDPSAGAAYWGRPLTSVITQPPMYGHALRVLADTGFDAGVDLRGRVSRGIRHLIDDRPRVNGLVAVFHPWETGCDDSARWDDWCPGGYVRERWREVKNDIVADLEMVGDTPQPSRLFTAGSAGFTALVIWNCWEASAAGVECGDARELVVALRDRWDPDRRTWTDADTGSGTARTLDGLLPLLVDPRDEAFDELLDPSAYGAEFGPCGVHREEPSFDPDAYWRGPAWPQLTYLLALAGRRAGRDDVAGALMESLGRAALTTGFAEYWNPDTGAARGAAPQTWTTLACVPV